MTDVRLQLAGVSKRYGAVRALDGADFELRDGETMALLGENGAGKSTLVKVLAGLVSPDDGAISISGSRVVLGSSKAAQAAGIAVVQQEFSSVPNLTVGENVFLGQSDAAWFVTGRRLAKRAEPLLAAVGLADLDPRTPVAHLGVAERQLIEIARVLARDASIVLLDEPTAALSDVEIQRVLGLVQRLAAEGRSVIHVTHRLAEVFRVADRITILRNGRSLAPVATSSVGVDDVITMMLGRKLDSLFPARCSVAGESALTVDGLRGPGLAEPMSFQVRRGEIVGLTGQLGSGANEVVKAIAGAIPATGSVHCGDDTVLLGSRRAGIRQGIAYCSADRKHDGVFAGLSVERNLTSPWLSTISASGVLSRCREREQAAHAASTFAIDLRRLAAAVGTLSGGNQQKVALGKWLAGGPRVLLVEEPTRGVDIGARAEIYAQLRMLCDHGLGIVVASSDPHEVLGLSDVIGALYRGRLARMAPHDQWDEASLARHVMHGDGTETAVA